MTSTTTSVKEPLENLATSEPGERDQGDPKQVPVSRWVLGAVSVGLMAACFSQEAGLIKGTSLTLAINPTELMGRALTLWRSGFQFGQVGNQTFGYLFPVGPFFAVGHWLHIPAWCLERLWIGVIFVAAFWGLVRLTEAMCIGTRWARVVGGLAYCLAPALIVQGANPAAMLPAAMLPWIMLPLVRCSVEGGSPRRAAAWSGVAVALMSGINATASLAVLPVPLLYLLTRRPRPRRLIAWWIVAVFLATFWWAVPLILQGHYGLNFLPYEETAKTTTATASASQALIGTSSWLNYYILGGPSTLAGWTLVSVPIAIVGTVVVPGIGLSGLALRRVPERFYLVLLLSVGMVLVAAGYGGEMGGVFGSAFRNLIDGPAAVFRNVSKFEPLVALPIAMGLVHILGTPWLRRPPVQWTRRPLAIVVLAVVSAAIILPAPFIRNQLIPSAPRLPSYWESAANWLNHRAGNQTSLLLPASSVPSYSWGQPNNEPMDAFAHTPWAVLNILPAGSIGSIRLMEAVEDSLDLGYPAKGLADYLARAGVGYLVVRNDLDLHLTGAPDPDQVATVLAQTPGIRLVHKFGPLVLNTYNHDLRAVDIYRVERRVEVVHAYPESDPVVVSGGTDSLLAMANAGLLEGNRATILAGDIGASGAVRAPGASWVVTDTVQRVDVDFGAVRRNSSYPLTPNQLSPDTGKPPQQFLTVRGIAHQTVAKPIGAAGVASSSYGSTIFTRSPAEGPASAFDGDPSTAWVASVADDSVGQWVSINFGRSVPMSTITVTPLDDSRDRPRVERLRITTQRGTVVRAIAPGEKPQTLRVPAGPSRWMRLTLDRVASPAVNTDLVGAGLRDVAIPGVHFQQALEVPSDETKAFARSGASVPSYVFSNPVYNPRFNLGLANPVEAHLTRFFTVPRAAYFKLTGTVTPRLGAALNALLRHPPAPLTPFVLACGQGPPVLVDGTPVPTRVTGTLQDLVSVSPLEVTSCVNVPLLAGRHLVMGADGEGPFRFTSLALRDALAPEPPIIRARSVAVKGFSGDNRQIFIGPGAASYVALASNFNPGWSATLGGRALQPVRIDGWQQGWSVPAGRGGTISVTFGPDGLYRISLLVGALLLLGVFVLAVVPGRRNRASSVVAAPVPPGILVVAGAGVVLALLGGPVALLALLPCIVVARLWPRLLPWVVAAAMTGLGVVLVVHAGSEPSTHQGPFGVAAQVLTLVALAAVLGGVCASAIASGWWRGHGARAPRQTWHRSNQGPKP
jgi:arabinofuranan 3-O-arabinosyltransferase